MPHMDSYSAIEMNEIMIRATTSRDLEDIMLSEIRQVQKGRYCMIPFL